MRFRVEIEYSVVLLRHICQRGRRTTVSAQQISKRESYPLPFVRKMLKQLAKGGIVRSIKGREGGYVLARRPSDITLRDIVESIEGEVFRVYCEPPHLDRIICTHLSECSLRPVWRELEKLTSSLLQRVTLETLVENEDRVRRTLQPHPPDLVSLQ